jgi:hypothetical protein
MAGLDMMPSLHPAVETAAVQLRTGDLTEDEYDDVVRKTARLQREAAKIVAANTAANAPHLAEVQEKLEMHHNDGAEEDELQDFDEGCGGDGASDGLGARGASPSRRSVSSPATSPLSTKKAAPNDTTVLSAIVEVKSSSSIDPKGSKGSVEEQAEWRGRYLVLKAEGLIEAAEWKGGKQAWRVGLHGLYVDLRPVELSATSFELQLRQLIEEGAIDGGEVARGAAGDGDGAGKSKCVLRMRFHNSEDVDKWMLALRACCKNAKPLAPQQSPGKRSKSGISSFFS